MAIRSITAAVALLALAGCAMSPEQKKWAGFAAGLVVVGMIAANDDSDGELPGGALTAPPVPCHPQPDGSCR